GPWILDLDVGDLHRGAEFPQHRGPHRRHAATLAPSTCLVESGLARVEARRVDPGGRVDLSFSEGQREFRAEVRDWLTAHVPSEPLPSMDTADGFERHRQWERTLAAARLSAVSWPEEYGGRGAGLIDWLIFEEEYWRSEAPGRVSQNGIFLLAPTLMAYGTE